MHLADGVLSTPVIVATYALSVGAMAYGAKQTEEEDIPKIALMAGTFFAVSLISIPVPPTSVHPLICGLIGIILGWKSPLAFFPALLLQALLFKHGGLTSLGANTIMLSIPAIISHMLYKKLPMKKDITRASITGGISVIMTVIILIILLMLTDQRFAAGDYSVIKIVILSHAPLIIVEGILTGVAVQFIEKAKPGWIK